MSYDHIKTLIQLLSSLQLALILGLTVAEDVEEAPEGVDLVDWVR